MVFLLHFIFLLLASYVQAADFSGVWDGSASLVTINEPPDSEGFSQFPCPKMSIHIVQTAKTLQIKEQTYSCDFADGVMDVESKTPAWQISAGKIFYNGTKIGTITANMITVISDDGFASIEQTFMCSSQGVVFREKETRRQDGKVIWDLKSNLLK